MEITEGLIQQFFDNRAFSARTKESYGAILRRFGAWAQEWADDKQIVQSYLSDLASRQASKTVCLTKAALSSFFEFLVEAEILAENPALRAKTPPAHSQPRIPISTEEALALLAHADQQSPRNAAVVRLFWATGIRLSELLSLDLADLDLADGCLLIRKGKGGKSRYGYFNGATSAALKRWLALRGEAPGPLFTNPQGERLSKTMVARVLARLAKEAGSTRRVSPHRLRHGSFTALSEAGVPIEEIQELAGHADISTTRGYIKVKPSRLRAAQARLPGG